MGTGFFANGVNTPWTQLVGWEHIFLGDRALGWILKNGIPFLLLDSTRDYLPKILAQCRSDAEF